MAGNAGCIVGMPEHEHRDTAQEARSLFGHRRGRYPGIADGAGPHDRRRALARTALPAEARCPPDSRSAGRRASGNPGRNPRGRARIIRQWRAHARDHRSRQSADAEDDACLPRRKRRAGIRPIDARRNGIHAAGGAMEPRCAEQGCERAAGPDRRRRCLRHCAWRGARPAGYPLHHCRKERRARRHLVRQSLSGLRRRYAEPFLFFLVRRAEPVDPLLRPTPRTARLPQKGRART
jgi:hypothetical protein